MVESRMRSRATRARRSALLWIGICLLGLAVVPAAGAFVYWADRGAVGGVGTGSTIGRASLDGTGVNDSFITGASGPVGVAVNGSSIFWANTFDVSTNSLGSANLDGSLPNQGFITQSGTEDYPCGVAVAGAYLYWANAAGGIGRATLDGKVVEQAFINTGEDHPCGIAVAGNYIYWTNERTGSGLGKTLSRATLDGKTVIPSFIKTGELPLGVAVDSNYIYWQTRTK